MKRLAGIAIAALTIALVAATVFAVWPVVGAPWVHDDPWTIGQQREEIENLKATAYAQAITLNEQKATIEKSQAALKDKDGEIVSLRSQVQNLKNQPPVYIHSGGYDAGYEDGYADGTSEGCYDENPEDRYDYPDYYPDYYP